MTTPKVAPVRPPRTRRPSTRKFPASVPDEMRIDLDEDEIDDAQLVASDLPLTSVPSRRARPPIQKVTLCPRR